MLTTADFATSPCANYPQTYTQKEQVASSPSLDIGNLLSLLRNQEATTPKQQRSLLILVDGSPLLISTKQDVEAQIKNSSDSAKIYPALVHTERLDLIKDRLSLTITQMAELLGVTRKTVYDWYDGAEPRPTMMNRLEILIDAINSVPVEVDLRRLKTLWNIPISGKSFRTVFSDDNIDINTLRTALIEKLNELSTRMVEKANSPYKSSSRFAEAQIAEYDRRGDFD